MKRIKLLAKRIIAFIFSLLGSIRAPFTPSKFEIKRGYFHRNTYSHFSDVDNTDEWQKEVYEEAKRIATAHKYTKIIDVGCGSGYKLIKYFGKDFDITGIEVKETYSYLLKNYPNHQWLNGETIDHSSLTAELLIVSDVIEHVVDPSLFLTSIMQIKGVKRIVISTPDRSLLNNPYGPPFNKTHMREWTQDEFHRFLVSQNLQVLSQEISNHSQATQLVICEISE